jgi:hypothetical protein
MSLRRNSCCLRRCRILPRSDGSNHPVTQPRHSLDVRRLARVIAELAPQRGHGLVNRIGRYGNSAPHVTDQFVDADNLPRPRGEAQKQSHRPHFEARNRSVMRNLTRDRIDSPGANAE